MSIKLYSLNYLCLSFILKIKIQAFREAGAFFNWNAPVASLFWQPWIWMNIHNDHTIDEEDRDLNILRRRHVCTIVDVAVPEEIRMGEKRSQNNWKLLKIEIGNCTTVEVEKNYNSSFYDRSSWMLLEEFK